MPHFDFFWTDQAVEHLAEHGVSPDDFEHVLTWPEKLGKSKSSGRPAAWAHIADGRYIIAVYEMLDDVTVLPVTAYEVDEP